MMKWGSPALTQALLGFGAGMLGGKDLQSGFAAGSKNLQEALALAHQQQREDERFDRRMALQRDQFGFRKMDANRRFDHTQTQADRTYGLQKKRLGMAQEKHDQSMTLGGIKIDKLKNGELSHLGNGVMFNPVTRETVDLSEKFPHLASTSSRGWSTGVPVQGDDGRSYLLRTNPDGRVQMTDMAEFVGGNGQPGQGPETFSNMSVSGEQTRQKKVGSVRGGRQETRVNDAISAGDTARQDLLVTNNMLDAMNSEGVYTGPGAGPYLAVKRLGNAVGFNFEGVPETEFLKIGTMKQVLGHIQQTKGAISEKEMKAFEDASAGISKSKAANRLILENQRRVQERLVEQAKMYRKWQNQGLDPAEIEQRWQGYIEANPIQWATAEEAEDATTGPDNNTGSFTPPPELQDLLNKYQ